MITGNRISSSEGRLGEKNILTSWEAFEEETLLMIKEHFTEESTPRSRGALTEDNMIIALASLTGNVMKSKLSGRCHLTTSTPTFASEIH
uniref:Uncharacterized protein n=1 Tax=Ascaris lumbricoides TaxID=6252 RepID=A0A0M3IJP1_ASCLU